MRSLSKLILFLCLFFSFTSLTAQEHLTVTSTAFKNNGKIPSKYTCEGREVNPPLRVKGIPAGAKSLALTVHDPDATEQGGVTHWVVWNLPVSGHIPEHFMGGVQGLNTANQNGYKGMCPPTGTHHYNFKVYALDTRLTLSKTTSKAGLEISILGHILAQGDLTGVYTKRK